MALNFTRQQLQGGGSYANNCRIGNWNEELAEEEAKHREFGTQKRSKSLLLSKKHAITNRILQACPVTSCERGDSVRYGDAVMLCNSETDGILSVLPSNSKSWDMTSVPSHRDPIARNVFILTPIPGSKQRLGDAIRYSDDFALITEPVLTADEDGIVMQPMWLNCVSKSFKEMSRLSTHSLVTMVTSFSNQSIWTMQCSAIGTDAAFLKNNHQDECLAGEPMAIAHRMTGTFLTSSKEFRFNGKVSDSVEYETFAMNKTKRSESIEWVVVPHNSPADNRGLRKVTPMIACCRLNSSLSESSNQRDLIRILYQIEHQGSISREDATEVFKEFYEEDFRNVEILLQYASKGNRISMDTLVGCLNLEFPDEEAENCLW